MLYAFVFLGWMFSRAPILSKEALSPRPTSQAFEITRELIHTQTPEDMLKLCDAGSEIRGCTRFVGESLEPEYSSSAAGQWRMTLKGRMVALIIVQDPGVITHEMHHIADMRESIDKLLHRWEERSYPSRAACVRAADAAVAGFRHELAVIAAESNARLR